MQREQEGADDPDAAWQSIIDNYGEPVLDADDIDDAPATAPASERPEPSRPAPERDDEERFVPPTPPPVPRPRADRLAAWIGLFGSPLVVLVSVVLDIGMPGLVGLALVAAFLGGFGYLIMTMDNEPPDPWDDGAQV